VTNPLKHAHEPGGVSEAYEVVRTAVVVLDGHTYRIDVLKGYVPPTAAYTARCTVPRRVSARALRPAAPPLAGGPADGPAPVGARATATGAAAGACRAVRQTVMTPTHAPQRRSPMSTIERPTVAAPERQRIERERGASRM
jgi:hypothetical protein